ncbi:hypothetical protein PTKIN_Ptkin16aG0021800 [Pterospermum kingtungense]
MADKVAASSLRPRISDLSESLIYISDAAQLSRKLTLDNHRIWIAQFEALLRGYGLIGYVDGSKPCPPASVMTSAGPAENPAYVLWRRQDHPVLHAILTSLSE